MTLVLAHRGASWDAPENTLAAFELAVEQGADYVEFDARTAPDGTLVVSHEPVSGEAPPGIPTLDATLEALRGRVGLAAEAKDGAAMKGLLAALKAHRIPAEDVLVLSFRIRDLWHAQRARPDLRYVLNLGRRPDPTAAARFWGVGFEDRSARPARLALAGSLGLAATVFTVNDPARMRELAALGVDGIFSDRPGLLRDVLETLAA
ncbi:MAG TPA: glycerophosphodiester phosphodiesterase [Gaiellaceae bacterium]|nr:glycerophosphodiester phosphodiesterase [Gaiellaceae bacterium]